MPNLIKKGFIVWFTGLPGSGKTTVANSAAEILRSRGFRVEVLDGDWVRRTISVGAGFSREERRRHLLRVAWVAMLLARNGVVVLCSFLGFGVNVLLGYVLFRRLLFLLLLC